MLVNHLNKLLRLYRNTAVFVALAAGLQAGIFALTIGVSQPNAVLLASMGTLGVVMWLGIEATRWVLQRMDEHWAQQEDPDVPKAFHVFTTATLVGQWVFSALVVTITGWPWAFTLLALCVAGACFMCRTKVAIGLLLGSVAVVLVQPALSGTQNGFWPQVCYGLQTGLSFLLWFQLGHYVATLVASSTQQVNRLQSLATTDALTGLMNRRLLMHQLQTEFSRARRHHSALCVALFDVDDFKKINDIYGHQIGDRILKELGALISHNVRDSDTAGRYGGEEFGLILPETRQTEAADLMERIRQLVERHVFCLPDNPMTITISVGLAQLEPRSHHSKDDLIHQTDAALYQAKQQGKNQVVYGVLPVPKISYTSTSQRIGGSQMF